VIVLLIMVVMFWDAETTGIEEGSAINVIVVRTDTESKVFMSDHGEPMGKDVGINVLDFLEKASVIVTFNGAAYDFKLLYLLTGDARAKQFARLHVDVMYHFATQMGYYSSMDSFAVASIGETKTETGEWAAEAWGTDPERVIDYCAQDTLVLEKLYEHALTYGMLFRKTQKGNVTSWPISIDGSKVFKTVEECTADYEANPPDQSWMTDPPSIVENINWCLL